MKVRGERYDVILLDMQMPVMDGVEAARAIRGDPHSAKMPIIALTTDALPENRARYLVSSCDAVVTKPIEWSALAREIKAVIAHDVAAQAAPIPAPQPAGPAPMFDRARIDGLADGLGPALLGNLLAHCVAGFEQYIGDVTQHVSAGDMVRARRAAHDLKSICAQFGALRASEIARSIETELADAEAVRGVLPELRAALDQGAAAIRRIQDDLPTDSTAAA